MASIDKMPGPGSYTNGVPSRSQKGLVMKDSFDQHAGHKPRPLTGSRQAAQSGGKARSSMRRKAERAAPVARLSGAGRTRSADNIGGHASAVQAQCHRPLVSRFRSSHALLARSYANFGIKGH